MAVVLYGSQYREGIELWGTYRMTGGKSLYPDNSKHACKLVSKAIDRTKLK